MVIIDKLAEPDIAKRCVLRAKIATTQAERDDWLEAGHLIDSYRQFMFRELGRKISDADLTAASSASHYSG